MGQKSSKNKDKNLKAMSETHTERVEQMEKSNEQKLAEELSESEENKEFDAKVENYFDKSCEHLAEDLKKCVAEVVSEAFSQTNDCKKLSDIIEIEMNRRRGRTWNCIVGSQFGIKFTHIKDAAVIYTYGHKSVVVYRSVYKSAVLKCLHDLNRLVAEKNRLNAELREQIVK